MFHPSAPLLSDTLFDTARQSLIFTELLPRLSRPKKRGSGAFRNSEDDFGYMASLHHSTSHESNQPDKMVPADDDVTAINDPDHDSICHFSETTHENTGCSVFLQCVKVHTQPNTLKSGDRNLLKNKEPGNTAEKAKEKVFGNTNKRMKAHIDKPPETGRVVAKTK